MKKIHIIDGSQAGDYYPAEEVDKKLAALVAEREAWKEYAIHQQNCGECAFHSSYCPEVTKLMETALQAQKAGQA